MPSLSELREQILKEQQIKKESEKKKPKPVPKEKIIPKKEPKVIKIVEKTIAPKKCSTLSVAIAALISSQN